MREMFEELWEELPVVFKIGLVALITMSFFAMGLGLVLLFKLVAML